MNGALTPSALTTRRWRDRRRRGVQLVSTEIGPNAVQELIVLRLVSPDDESLGAVQEGVQELVRLLESGRLRAE